jgi:hypothetical protein
LRRGTRSHIAFPGYFDRRDILFVTQLVGKVDVNQLIDRCCGRNSGARRRWGTGDGRRAR